MGSQVSCVIRESKTWRKFKDDHLDYEMKRSDLMKLEQAPIVGSGRKDSLPAIQEERVIERGGEL